MRGWQVSGPGVAAYRNGLESPLLDHADTNGVVVAVEAAAANFADSLMIKGTYQERPNFPFTPGIEVAGTVITTNSDLLGVGDKVVGLTTPGTGSWAEDTLCDARQLTVIPADVDPISAIGLHVNAQTAWFALHRRAALRPGDRVLVHAAAGGVGSMAVQLGVAAGCDVYATTSPSKTHVPISLGATASYNNRDPDWPAQIRDQVGPVNVIIDPVGGTVFNESWRLLAFEGRIVTVGFASGNVGSLQANHALVKNISLHGVYWTRYTLEAHDLVATAAAEIFELARGGLLDPCVTVVDHISNALDRLHDVASGATTGKTVLVPDTENLKYLTYQHREGARL